MFSKKWLEMSIQSTKNILLLGAGFSKNFGAPLANEMWYLVFNHEGIQAQPRLKKLMLNNFNFELIYDCVLLGFIDKEGLLGEKDSFIDFTNIEKNAIREAINNAYEFIDEIFIEYKNRYNHVRGFTSVDQFIYHFPPQVQGVKGPDGKTHFISPDENNKTFIFTLNQDLFFERTYPNFGVKLSILGEKQFGLLQIGSLSENGFDEKLKPSDYCKLPNQDELDHKKDSLLEGNYFLVKLHGSYNWIGIDGSRAMVIGSNKEEQINKEPLLKCYFEIFKKVLSQSQRYLLIIGYSFGDKHINNVIANAVKNHGLKIYILSPEPLKTFNKESSELSEKSDDLIDIYNGISGCSPYTKILKEDLDSYQTIRRYFNNVFFGNAK
jgi:hypothetical protein